MGCGCKKNKQTQQNVANQKVSPQSLSQTQNVKEGIQQVVNKYYKPDNNQ